MKKLALIALLALPAATLADEEDIDEAAKAVLDSVRDNFASENATGVADNFSGDEEDKVRLNLEGKDQSYSKDHAKTALKNYFKSVEVDSVESDDDTYKGGGSPSAKFEYKFTKNGKQYTKRLYVSVRKKGDAWVVSRIEVTN